jgi:hypothetical protein
MVDRRIARYLTGRILRGVLSGVAGGLLLGAAAALVLIAATGPTSWAGELLALALVGMVLGAMVGAFVGFERSGTLSDAWPSTFEDLDGGAVWVVVSASNRKERERIRRTLASLHPARPGEYTHERDAHTSSDSASRAGLARGHDVRAVRRR